MLLARLRVEVPDRPGALGGVASALGRAGADIAGMDVLESSAGRALDDVLVRVRDERALADVVAAVRAVPGARVVGVQHPAPPTTGHAELELVAAVLARPGDGMRTLVHGAPLAAGADWAAVLTHDARGDAVDVVAVSDGAPDAASVPLGAPMRLATPTWPRTTGAAVVPLDGARLSLAVARRTGPAFHRSELWRLEQVGRIVGPVLAGVRA